ncbi:spore coat protein CotJB [Bacillus norwichensis]|uniref:Spore coat protein CotJB n=1 Tax=Bacillus norwichensis TaxID=2762217 RepID=A0ABR8VNQ0_9BACI|nr:spore coat protein CotJB [Bacillus norwichensis]MBD8006395.1 spore coat protein CotJB [Bacillus norwichensis]
MKQMPPEYYKQLEELQVMDFVIVELALYLNTHPGDMDAIRQYNEYIKNRKAFLIPFEQEFGPITSFGYSYSKYPWEWKESPWPWQV